MKRSIRKRLARQAIASWLHQHRVPGNAQNVKRYPNWTNEHFFLFLAVGTNAEVNKEVYIMKLG